MSGVVTEFDLTSIKSLDNEILNLAELELFHYGDFENDNSLFYPPAASLALVKGSDGFEINDLLLARFNSFIDILFGGNISDPLPNSLKCNPNLFPPKPVLISNQRLVGPNRSQSPNNPSRVLCFFFA